jgi:hypothetical protein
MSTPHRVEVIDIDTLASTSLSSVSSHSDDVEYLGFVKKSPLRTPNHKVGQAIQPPLQRLFESGVGGADCPIVLSDDDGDNENLE